MLFSFHAMIFGFAIFQFFIVVKMFCFLVSIFTAVNVKPLQKVSEKLIKDHFILV